MQQPKDYNRILSSLKHLHTAVFNLCELADVSAAVRTLNKKNFDRFFHGTRLWISSTSCRLVITINLRAKSVAVTAILGCREKDRSKIAAGKTKIIDTRKWNTTF